MIAFTAVNDGSGAVLFVTGTDGKPVPFATAHLTDSAEVTLVLANEVKAWTMESNGRLVIQLRPAPKAFKANYYVLDPVPQADGRIEVRAYDHQGGTLLGTHRTATAEEARDWRWSSYGHQQSDGTWLNYGAEPPGV